MNIIIEKDFIPQYFKDFPKGRFLEIGANDGDPIDPNEPCWPLLQLGWSGVYCEPSPFACTRLINNVRRYRKRIKVINTAITATGGFKTFYMHEDHTSCSSLQSDWIQKQPFIKKTKKPKQYAITTNTSTMQQLIDQTGANFNCVSIDIECDEHMLENMIMSFDWTLLTECKLFVIENANKNVLDYFESIGFPVVAKSQYNTLLGKL